MRLGSVSYVPPPSIRTCDPAAFLANLRRFQSKHPLMLYSDHKWDVPDMIHLPQSPEIVKDAKGKDGKPNPWAVNNLCWATGMRIAIRNGFTHVIYLEADCRVGKLHWDDQIFSEYFSHPKTLACAGSLVSNNPCNAGPIGYQKWCDLMATNTRRNFPNCVTYGWKGAADSSGSSIFPNGALGCYSVAWLTKLFDFSNSGQMAAEMFAWDFALGERLWKEMDHLAYDCVAPLQSVFSSYGEVITSERERMELLRSGKVSAVHQCKSSQQP